MSTCATAAFVVISPDAPDKQRQFAESRGWKFPTFPIRVRALRPTWAICATACDAGVSVFKRSGDKILGVSDTSFSPGDDFCTVRHFFDLIPEDAAWKPKYKYA